MSVYTHVSYMGWQQEGRWPGRRNSKKAQSLQLTRRSMPKGGPSENHPCLGLTGPGWPPTDSKPPMDEKGDPGTGCFDVKLSTNLACSSLMQPKIQQSLELPLVRLLA
jgi:hypothetical protein